MRHSLLAVTLLALSCSATAAAKLELAFSEPEKYTDIRSATESKARFQQRVLNRFEQFFTELANQMPEGYQWQVTVTDIDLAGDVDYFAGGAGQAMRIVKDIHSPAIRFSHQLRDQYGEEVLSADERLRDMGFMHRLSSTGIRPEFEFEQKMLEDWFSKTVQVQLDAHASLAPKVSQP
ncbi:DUF3016 domain-containing protein [Arsukibacterium sp.]|uniref:DUF3016 domain-containing protein n=1 Tax=Arsukibacterium sp. TaxID=1977258 RepID=UPI002FD8D77C